MFRFAAPRPTRRPSLTPMIDVVFLLLVFFMLAARFGQDVGLVLAPGGSGSAAYDGPPRLVEFSAGQLWLNGIETQPDQIVTALGALMPDPEALVILRPRDGASLQDLADLTEQLQAQGFLRLVVLAP